MFENKNKQIMEAINSVNENFERMREEHTGQVDLFNQLDKQNREAIKMHNQVKQTFRDESDMFFAERRKWKTDFTKASERQEERIQSIMGGVR